VCSFRGALSTPTPATTILYLVRLPNLRITLHLKLRFGRSSAYTGEVTDTGHKADKVNTRKEPAIDGSNMSFGLDGP
jgi:hypothetical protein